VRAEAGREPGQAPGERDAQIGRQGGDVVIGQGCEAPRVERGAAGEGRVGADGAEGRAAPGGGNARAAP